MKLIIPVAGRGTRVRPHSFSKPKPLIQVARKTAIEYILDNLLTLNPQEVIIIHDKFNGDAFKEVLPPLYPKTDFKFILQEKALGTAHVITLVKDLIKPGEDLLINFCDTLFKKDLSCIKDLSEHDGIIFVQEVEDYQRFGVVVHKDRIMTQIVEKPDKPISKLANIGTYYIKDGPEFIRYASKVVEEDRRVKGELYLTEAFSMMIKDGKKLWVEDIEKWLDVGKIETLLETNAQILNGEVYKGYDVIIEDSTIGKNVSIGNNSVLRDCKVKNSIIGENTTLEGLEIENSIIGDHVILKKDGKKFNIGDYSCLT